LETKTLYQIIPASKKLSDEEKSTYELVFIPGCYFVFLKTNESIKLLLISVANWNDLVLDFYPTSPNWFEDLQDKAVVLNAVPAFAGMTPWDVHALLGKAFFLGFFV